MPALPVEKYPSRPVTMPERDYVVVSPTDCIMNPLIQMLEADTGEVDRRRIENPLQQDTVLDVKGIPISVSDLLAGAPDDLKKKFTGGSGLACVLMPNTYHHFHSTPYPAPQTPWTPNTGRSRDRLIRRQMPPGN